MGKPSSSCLKIIACGSDSSVEDGNTQSSEAKGSGEKCGWIFRKRSAKHRVLSNNDTSPQNLTVGAAKEAPQSISIGSETPTLPNISEKVLALEQPNEKHQTPALDLEPSKSTELEPSEALDAPKQPEPLGSDVLERVDASEAPELVEPEGRVSMGEPETLHPVEPELPVTDATFALEKPESVEPNICVSGGESESLNLIDSEIPEIKATFALEPPELVEPTIQHVSVAESNSLNLNDPEVVPETLTASSLEPPEQAEMKTCEEDVAPKPHVSAELKPSQTLVSSQDDNLEEPLIITIQAGIRGFLAQREIVKLRSTIKLQAAIRGHLVRRQAVDTLYCMQGIIKVQNLVRAHSSKANGVSVTKQITRKPSTEKLLRNAFARQLIESTPKSKSTIITCDPLKPNSAWTWLERWMNVSSSGLSYSETPEIMEEGEQSQGEKISPIMECEDLSQVKLDSINPEITVEEASKTFEFEKGSIINDPTEEYQASNLQSSEEKMEQTHDSTDASLGMVAQNLSAQSDSHSQPQSGSLSNNLIVETNEPKLSTKRMMAFDQVDVENKKLASGSRKASNPAFILAQSKFEVLSSAASNCASSLEESVHKEEDPISSEALKPDETKFNIGGSECGTQLSVTSTLDSPDQSEAEVVEMEVKLKSLEEGSNNLINGEDLEVTTNGHSSVYVPNSSPSTLSQKEIPESNGVPNSEAITYDEHDDGEYVVLNMAQDSTKVEQKPESASDLHEEAGSWIEQPTSDVPVEATPNNDHMAIAESQRTPSKHASVKIKKNKGEKSGSNKKHGSHSTSKRTVGKALQNSGVRSSGEKLPKDQKSAKRRNSLGSTKYDHIDQEPQSNTSSSKTLPSYMQATQSAKAKAHSPRSSSDLQDKDTNLIKKRHSLAGAGGRHGSPRVQQQPTSQSPQSQVVCLGNV